jgi:hypothetical protein
VLAGQEVLRAANMAAVDKFVDYFLQSRAKNSFYPLVNPRRFLLKHATPYLSADIFGIPCL